MEPVYTHQHVTQAHHHGLVAGVLIGSIGVSLFVAVALVIASPRLILHPFSLTSKFSSSQSATPVNQTGAGVDYLSAQSKQSASGRAADAAKLFSD
ncbi:MAG: hypothetical protein ACXWLH_03165 [Candidatus Saccharimonadales bacterium]